MSQIQAFHAVMTSASLSEAARKLGRTQPAVSAAIKTLEDQLDLKLFTREGRKLVPVPEAQYLLTETTAILGQLTRVRRTMKSLADGQTGSLNIAAMPGPAAMLFPRFVASQIEPDAGTSVSILARSSTQIAELARAQSIDFGFSDAPEDLRKEDLYKAEIISGKSFVALPMHHPLARHRDLSVRDLDGVPMGSLLTTHAHQREVQTCFEAANAHFSLMVEGQAFLQAMQFVREGLCCAIVDPLTVAHINATSDLARLVTIRSLTETVRYRYAIIEPRYRPISVLALQIKAAWREEVVNLLHSVGADPVIGAEPQSMSDSMSL
ncbi:MAG: LysR substrate-binding domain-containing protein [Pseudomonadota bacterium]